MPGAQKLKPDDAIKVLQLARDMKEDGKEIGESILKNQLCAPMVVKASWHKAMLKQFGEVCRSSAAMARVISSLESKSGLGKICSCMASNVPLHGVSDENIGISECRVLFKEFQRLKSGGKPGTETTAEAEQPQEAQDMAVELETLGADENMATSVPEVAMATTVVESEEDNAAREGMLRQMDRIHRFSGPDAISSLQKSVKSYLNTTTRTCFLIDTPTSRPKVATEFVDAIKGIVAASNLTSFSIVVTCAGRLDYMSTLRDKLALSFPQAEPFVTILTTGSEVQSQKRKTKFALVLHHCPPKQVPTVPTSILAMKGKARAWEGLRMRCLSLSCPLRSTADKALAQGKIDEENKKKEELRNMIALQKMELNGDDCAEPDDNEEAMSEEEDPGESAGQGHDEGKRDFIVELFTFTRSMSYYTPILEQLLVVAGSGATYLANRRTLNFLGSLIWSL